MIELVEAGWRNALHLPIGARELTLSWEAAGGESLAMLQLLLELEEKLGRKLDYALIEPDMCIADMAAALRLATADSPASSDPVFLLPGVFGHRHSLTWVRKRLNQRWQTRLVEFPDLDQAADLLADMAMTGRFVAERIADAQPTGAIRLAGWSFGGCVAHEAAQHLDRMGREIAFLGIVDAAFGAAALDRHPASSFGRRRDWLKHRLMLALLWLRPVRLLALAAISLLPGPQAVTKRNAMAWLFRTEARVGWRPLPGTAAGFVAVSDEFAPQILPLWQTLLPHARFVRLPGSHMDIFRGDTKDVSTAALEAALADHAPR
jgi:thioesterase domain-containing protein